MKSAPSYLVLLLALTTVGGAVFSWKQHQELVALRAAAFNSDDRANLQKRLWDAEKRAKALAAELAAARTHPEGSLAAEDAPAAGSEGPSASGNIARRENRRANGPFGGFAALMEKPEVQKLMALQQKGMLDASYAPLFKSLNLTPEQLDKFKDLLVEKQMAMMDVMAAARAEGVNPRSDPDGFRKMIASAQADIDNSIRSTLGDTGFAQYQQYQQTFPQRSTVNQLQQSLSYTNTPLSDAQANQLVQVLAQTGGVRTNTANRNLMFGGPAGPALAMGGGGAQITTEAITQAQGILSAPQLQALQQLQQQQQSQQQLQQAMRQSFGGGNRGNGGGGAAKAAPKN